MLGRLFKKKQRLRQIFSRSEWAAKYLRLGEQDRRQPDQHTPGVVIIQIDGLGYDQLLQAIDRKKLPFLQRLIQRENFVLRRFYSGLPSTTPAVQAELFYGLKSAVPAFQYYDRAGQKKRVMFEPETVDAVAARLDSTGEGLLVGGSSYSNIFAGGADEAPFSIQSMKLQSIFAGIRPGKIAWFILINLEKIVRVVILSFQEMGLALIDFFRAVGRRRNPFLEFRFIFSRIGACIVLRELIRMHVKIDIARGLRIIHANFIGYDEHAHRRNPDSIFAMRTLKGIDAVIKDIVSTAVRSERRDYQIFIYSDHGQEAVSPFESVNGDNIHRTATRIFSSGKLAKYAVAEERPSVATHRSHRHRLSLLRRAPLGGEQQTGCGGPEPNEIRVAAMGPLGHIYLPCKISRADMLEYARQLVKSGGVPLVFLILEDRVVCVTATGAGNLDDKAREAFGDDHPFLDQLIEDMELLCRHADAGDFIISGYRTSGTSLSFAAENGAHGGPGTKETGAFVILPDVVSGASQTFLRPVDLRNQIRAVFKEKPSVPLPVVAPQPKMPLTFTVMTYNIHSCIGMDGKLFPARIARIIGRCSPDIVALQEVDRNMARTENHDQLEIIAEQLGMHSCYFPVLKNDEAEYGLAVLSRFPLVEKHRLYLPDLGPAIRSEKRGLLWTTLQTPVGRLHLLNTHLSLIRRERLKQMRHIVEAVVADAAPTSEPLILCGDFNAVTNSPPYAILSQYLRDCQQVHAHIPPVPTFFSSYPLLRLDHIFHSAHLAPASIGVLDDWECRLASDHLPLHSTLLYDPERR